MRPAPILLALFFTAPLVASPRYLVATREAPPHAITFKTAGGEVRREVTPFRYVRGYAVELTSEELASLRQSPDVRWIEPDRTLTAFDDFAEGERARTPRAEREQSISWGIDAVRAFAVRDIARGQGIKVAIVDTGIDATHPDLAANIRGGYDFVDRDDTPQDGAGHGTHVAGIIAAADNTEGVLGVAPLAELYALRVLNDSGEGTTSAEIEAVEWAIANGMNIVNLSLGSSTPSDLEREVFEKASDAGILAIAASGNAGASSVAYPAAYPSVTAVSAVDRALRLASFSNIGDEVDLAAPGVRIRSTVPTGTGLFVEVATANGLRFEATTIEHSALGSVSGHFVYCGLGRAEDIPSGVSGNIALIRRGEISFAEKAVNAILRGATAVVVLNNIPNGDTSGWTFGEEGGPWPLALGISMEDGETLQQMPDVELSVDATTDDYRFLSGTSMATPHVAGVAAMVWSLDPEATSEQVRQAMLTTARDLGSSGFDSFYGNGLVDAEAAGKQLAPQKFPSRKLRFKRSR